jgi:hypothetical protein
MSLLSTKLSVVRPVYQSAIDRSLELTDFYCSIPLDPRLDTRLGSHTAPVKAGKGHKGFTPRKRLVRKMVRRYLEVPLQNKIEKFF